MGTKIDSKVKEGVRAWYDRTTKNARRTLVFMAAFVTVFSVAFFALAPDWLILKLQIFNGAVTIPIYGALWLGTFIFIWMLPIREVSFRSQESMENMESRATGLEEKVNKILDKLDKKIDSITDEDIDKMKRVIDKAAKSVEPLPFKRRTSNEVEAKP